MYRFLSLQFYVINFLRIFLEKIDGNEEKIPILSCQGTNLSDLVFVLTTSDLLSKKDFRYVGFTSNFTGTGSIVMTLT
jgi:hypothetical protein